MLDQRPARDRAVGALDRRPVRSSTASRPPSRPAPVRGPLFHATDAGRHIAGAPPRRMRSDGGASPGPQASGVIARRPRPSRPRSEAAGRGTAGRRTRRCIRSLADLRSVGALREPSDLAPSHRGAAAGMTGERHAVTGELTRPQLRWPCRMIDGRPVYAATDLVGFLACEHLTPRARGAGRARASGPMRDDPELDIIRKRGVEHEERYLADLARRWADRRRDRARRLDRGPRRPAPGRRGRDARRWPRRRRHLPGDVLRRPWRGHADFLLRVDDPERPSAGARGTTRSPTPSSRATSRPAPCSRSARTSTSWSAIQGVGPERMHVALGGSARAVERLRVDDFMAYYRGAKRGSWRPLADRDAAAYPPAGHLSGAGRALRRLPLGAPSASPGGGRTTTSASWPGISGRQRAGAHGAGRRPRSRRSATCRCRSQPRLEGIGGEALVRVREQARHPARGRGATAAACTSCCCPIPDDDDRAGAGPRVAPAALAGRPVLRPRRRPVRARRRPRLPVRRARGRDGDLPCRSGRATTTATFTPGRRAARVRALMDLFMERLAATRPAHLPLRAVRAHRAQAPDGPLRHPRGRGRPPAPRRRPRRPATRRPPVAAGVGRELLDQEDGAFYGFTREIDLRDAGSSIVAFEQWLELGEGERPAADHLERIERYNRDDVVSNRAAARLARGAARPSSASRPGTTVPRPGPRARAAGGADRGAGRGRRRWSERLADPAIVPTDPADRTPEQQARWLLAQLLAGTGARTRRCGGSSSA